MKQKNFWRKLLSFGLAAAMMIASLTGPGAVANPVEVKAEETTLAGKIESVGLEFTYAATKDNDTYELPEGPLNTTLQEITVNVTTGGPVKISSPNLSSGVVMQKGFTIEFRKDGELVSYGEFGPGEYTVTASYETDDIQPYEGKFTITKATSSTGDQEFGELNITGIMKSGETIKAELTSPPEGVSYTFYRVKGTEETQLETKDNTYTLTDADVGATIKVTVAASGYKEKSVTSGVVESANNGSVADMKPAAPTFKPVTGTSFDSSLSVEITTTTADAAIYYTLDGKDPTAESSKYEAPFTINATTTSNRKQERQGYDEEGRYRYC